MPIQVGLQAYTVREAMRFDPLGTLDKTALAGYRFVELPIHNVAEDTEHYYGKSMEEWRDQALKSGIRIIGAYVAGLDLENVDKVCDFYSGICGDGARLVIPIAYYPDREALDEKCRLFNELGKICAARGLRLFYENHYHEFQIVDGRTVMEVLMEQTEPEFLSLSLNTYWLMRGLVEPLEVFARYRDRIGSIVQQDYPLKQIDKFNMWNFKNHHPIAHNIQFDRLLKGNEIENIHPVQCELFAEIGNGVMKLQPVIDAANGAGEVSYVLLKQDFTEKSTEFESIRISLSNYRKVRGVKF